MTTRLMFGSICNNSLNASLNPLIDSGSERFFGVKASMRSRVLQPIESTPLPTARPTRLQLMRVSSSVTFFVTAASLSKRVRISSRISAMSVPRTSSWLSYCHGSVLMTTNVLSTDTHVKIRLRMVDLPPPQGLWTPIVSGSRSGVLIASKMGRTTASNPNRSTSLGLSSQSWITSGQLHAG